MDYDNLMSKLPKLRSKLDNGNKAKKELLELLEGLTEDPPESPIYFTFSSDKWSSDYRANFLLHFIEMKGLSQEADDFLSMFSNREDDE